MSVHSKHQHRLLFAVRGRRFGTESSLLLFTPNGCSYGPARCGTRESGHCSAANLHQRQFHSQIDYVSILYQQISEIVLTCILQSNQWISFPSEFALCDKDFTLVEDATHPMVISCNVTNGKAMNNDDTPLPLPSSGLDPSIAIDSQEQVLQRLITRAVSRDKLPNSIPYRDGFLGKRD